MILDGEMDGDIESSDLDQDASDIDDTSTSSDDDPIEDDWEPNFSVKVRNQRYDIDEMFRPLITDRDSEQKVKEVFAKAHGLDHMKQAHDTLYQKTLDLELEAERYREENEFAKQGIEGLKKLAKEDFPSFAHIVGLDDNTILSYANRRLDYREKPEHERHMIDREMDTRTQTYTQAAELQKLQRQNESLMKHQHDSEMKSALSMPEISSFEKLFDKRMGKDGAFREHVRQYGSNEFKASKRYVPPLVAVQTVYNQFKPLFQDALENAKDELSRSNKGKKKPPSNLGNGRSSATVPSKIKSIADLRKRANELAKQGR